MSCVLSLGSAADSRKRKKRDEREDPVGVVPNDKDTIKSIVTKRLWSNEDRDEVFAAMFMLIDIFNSNTNSNSIENRKFAFHRGAPLAIAWAMDRHANDPKIQKTGLCSLSHICACHLKEAEQTIIDTGGMQRCLLSMEQHHDDPIVQGAGCTLIGKLWFRSDGARKNVFDAGGLTAVLNAMKNYKQDSDLQHCGCYALNALVSAESTFIQAVADAGGIKAGICSMESHPTIARLQSTACRLLTALAKSHGDYRKSIIGAKGLIAVAEVLRVHHDKKNMVREAKLAIKAIIS